MSDGRPMPAGWLAAMVGALAAVLACVLFVAWNGQTTVTPPIPSISPTAPAPLPPGTGLDGRSELGDPVVPPVITPDIPGAEILHGPEGTGGVALLRNPLFKKPNPTPVNAWEFYSSGRYHGGIDWGVWRGTKVHAARDSVVVGLSDGVQNHPSGSQYAIPGSASNWVLLCAEVDGRPAILYHQHLSPGVKEFVRIGMKVRGPVYGAGGKIVKYGQTIAKSGNTGFSTGDHLHSSASWLPNGLTCRNLSPARAASLRYDYLASAQRRMFAPTRWWDTREVIVLKRGHSVEWVARKHDVKTSKLCKLNPTVKNCAPQKRLKAGARVRIG